MQPIATFQHAATEFRRDVDLQKLIDAIAALNQQKEILSGCDGEAINPDIISAVEGERIMLEEFLNVSPQKKKKKIRPAFCITNILELATGNSFASTCHETSRGTKWYDIASLKADLAYLSVFLICFLLLRFRCLKKKCHLKDRKMEDTHRRRMDFLEYLMQALTFARSCKSLFCCHVSCLKWRVCWIHFFRLVTISVSCGHVCII
jgi:hypothetical protein